MKNFVVHLLCQPTCEDAKRLLSHCPPLSGEVPAAQLARDSHGEGAAPSSPGAQKHVSHLLPHPKLMKHTSSPFLRTRILAPGLLQQLPSWPPSPPRSQLEQTWERADFHPSLPCFNSFGDFPPSSRYSTNSPPISSPSFPLLPQFSGFPAR